MRANSPFSTPPVVLNLIIVNALFYLAEAMIPGGREWIIGNLGLFFWESDYFHAYQIVTHMFLHANFTHLFTNMFALWMFGRTLEYSLGGKRFLIYYMITGIGAALLQLGVSWIEVAHLKSAVAAGAGSAYELAMAVNTPMIGASGAVFGVLLAFGMMYPNSIIMLLIPPIPIKAKYFVIGYGVIELLLGVTGNQSGVAHFAHVGGMIFGFFLLRYWKRTGKIFY